MFLIISLALLASSFAVDLPQPKLKILPSGDYEFIVEDVQGLEVLDMKYTVSGKEYRGAFKQAVDGHWYHRHSDASVNEKKIRYVLIGLVNKELAVAGGYLAPDENNMVVLPPKRVRRGHVVFRDDFNGAFNPAGWNYEVSMYGGYNWEVQVYVPEAANVFTRNGHLFIKPTLTRDHPGYNDNFLHTGVIDLKAIYGYCTNADRYGCYREGRNGLLPPVMSGKITTKATIRFGSVEVRARTPCGDWIWPAIWMLPRNSEYGGWPRSGEIDIMESRGNTVANDGHKNHGRNEVGATLHWGPDAGQNRFSMTHGTLDGDWCTSMHTYTLDWTVDHIVVRVDGHVMMNIPIGQSFWDKGHFGGSNLWASGTKAAPFDKDFYLILNVAIAGTNGFFPDNWHYDTRKPWSNNSPTEPQDFWNGRNDWLPTWHGDAVAMEIDYVQMTQY